ncbi:MAG: hypothetical protein ACKOC1_00825 [Hyphomicrobiales bacterium]
MRRPAATEGQVMHGLPVSVRVGFIRERGYDQARRHSVRVRFLRRILPFSAIFAALLLIVLPYIRPLELINADLDLGSLTLDGKRITMEMPDLRGFRGDNKPYSISARQATQDVTRPNILELVELTSRIETKPGSVARLRSDSGIYDSRKDLLSVRGNVRIVSGASDIRMISGLVDFKANTVVSTEPVQVVMASGAINADAMRVFENGERILFSGHVRSYFKSRSGTQSITATNAGVPE